MANTTVHAVAPPALPLPGDKYDRLYFNQFIRALNGFFAAVANAVNAAITNVSSAAVAVQALGGVLNISQFSNFNVNVGQLDSNITTIMFPTTLSDGQTLTLRFQQTNAGGPFTVTGWPTNVLIAGGSYVMTPALGAYDLLTFHYDLDADLWFEQSRSQDM